MRDTRPPTPLQHPLACPPPLTARPHTPQVDAGAWIVIDEAPALILKDRILDTQIPGNPAPVWKELAELLGQSSELLAGTSSAELLRMIYPPEAEDGGGNAFDDSPGATG